MGGLIPMQPARIIERSGLDQRPSLLAHRDIGTAHAVAQAMQIELHARVFGALTGQRFELGERFIDAVIQKVEGAAVARELLLRHCAFAQRLPNLDGLCFTLEDDRSDRAECNAGTSRLRFSADANMGPEIFVEPLET